MVQLLVVNVCACGDLMMRRCLLLFVNRLRADSR